jgi:hypothetical protein
MPIEIVNGKWREETPHGRIICQIKSDGIHVQKVTNLEEGRVITHEEKLVSFQEISDFTEGQQRIV